MNDGGPAFAAGIPAAIPEHGAEFQCGMSLRDWFAGMALQGLIAHHGDKDVPLHRAYEIARVMLDEREGLQDL